MSGPELQTGARTKRTRWAVIAILVLGLALRIILSLLNREANDQHIYVIGIIQTEGRFPHADDCWECFQPKLYHALCAAIGWAFNIQTLDAATVTFQMVNAFAGLLTLWVLLRFLWGLPIRDDVLLFGFGGVALNPELIGINVQVTNDSLVILLGTVAISSLWGFLQSRKVVDGVSMIVGAVLACITKATGLAVTAGIALALFLAIVANWRRVDARSAYLRGLVAMTILFLAVVPYFGQYYYHWKTSGDAFKTGIPRSAPPKLFEFVPDPAYKNRLGVTTLSESWFTFRIVDLIRNPYISNGYAIEPRHRSSLWTQMYGHAHFVHFPQFPLSWQDRGRFIMGVGRAIFLLALAHLLLTLSGLAAFSWGVTKGVWGVLRGEPGWMMALLTITSAAMMLQLTYSNRDFSAMKMIYVLPFLICFLYLFVVGCQRLFVWCAGSGVSVLMLEAVFVALYTLYVVDIVYLAAQLLSLQLYPH